MTLHTRTAEYRLGLGPNPVERLDQKPNGNNSQEPNYKRRRAVALGAFAFLSVGIGVKIFHSMESHSKKANGVAVLEAMGATPDPGLSCNTVVVQKGDIALRIARDIAEDHPSESPRIEKMAAKILDIAVGRRGYQTIMPGDLYEVCYDPSSQPFVEVYPAP